MRCETEKLAFSMQWSDDFYLRDVTFEFEGETGQ